MSIQTTLLPEEQIAYYTRPHYIVFSPTFLWLILAMFTIKFTVSVLLSGAALLMIGISLSQAIINYCWSEYVITNKRILLKQGLIRIQSREIFLERVEGVYIEQSIIGRLLNFGIVIIIGIGGTKTRFLDIPEPWHFQRLIQQMQPSARPPQAL